MSITINIAGSPVAIIANDTIQISDKEAGTSTAQFTIRDDAGTGNYSQQMTVIITDSVRGLQFSGYIDTAQPELLNPGPQKKWLIICKDKTWLASKRQTLLPDFGGTLAGDVVTDLHAKYLAAEGVTANYALDHDTNSATFGLGTLVSTSAASGDLTLANAGSTFTKTEKVSADFSTGTLTNTSVAGNALSLSTVTAMKLTGTCTTGPTNAFSYVQFWSGSVLVAAGDVVNYTIWIDSTSPAIVGGIDFVCSDGTTMRDGGGGSLDQEQLSAHPQTDLSGYADDQWYFRQIPPALVGKTITVGSIVFESEKTGPYTMYICNVALYSSVGVLKQTFFNGTLNANSVISNAGYVNTTLSTAVVAASVSGSRVSPSYSIAGPGIAKASLLSWQATVPGTTSATGANSQPYVTVETSYDGGASWQMGANHAPITGLLPGTKLTGKSLLLRETLYVAGPDPAIYPTLASVTATIAPSYSATKTDTSQTYLTSTDLSTGGTTTNLSFNASPASMQLTGFFRTWDQAAPNTADMTGFGTGPVLATGQRSLNLRCNPTSDVRGRFDTAGSWADFTAEFDVLLVDAVGDYGLVYRTTGWQNLIDTQAYIATISSTKLSLGRGTNTGSGAGAFTSITSYSAVFATNRWYRMKIVVAGNNHKIYLDNVWYISFNDSTYPAAGQVALRHYNPSAGNHGGYFANFGITSSVFTGQRVFPGVSISSVGTAGGSIINWQQMAATNTSVLVEASLNGGSTYATCTNGGQIPGIANGTNVAGLSLMLRATLTTQNASNTPQLNGLSWLIPGRMNATGTRVSPALSIGSVGRVGSSSITWTADTPTGTTLVVEESLIGSGGAWTTATNGGAIPTITAQPVSVSDSFSVSTAGNYTNTNYAGVNATWTFDTANNRLTALNGTNGLYVWNQVSAKDVQIDALLNQTANAGLIWRYTNASNFYFAIISDASSGTNPNTIKIYKRVAGVTSGVLATGTIAFTRGTYHTFRVVMSTTSITAYFDGVSVTSITDASLAGPGSIGFLQSSTTQTNWYSIRGQQFGDDVTGKSVWTRLTLSSTDPTLTPAVTDLVTSVRGQQLMSGIVIGPTDYQYKGSVEQALSDVAKRCPGYTVGITDASALTFQSHQATPADWPLATTNSTLIGGQQIGDVQWSTPPILKRQSPLYRNRSIIVGGTDVTALIPDTRMGDGFTQTWQLAYPVAVAPVITLNAVPSAVGVQGVDTGMDFYYQIGSNTISQDVAATPLSSDDLLYIPYYGQIDVVKQSDNVAQQTIVAALEGGTSGIVEVLETITGLNAAAAQATADSRVAQYAILSQDWTFTTLRPGLKSGQLLNVFCPEYPGMNDVLALITQVDQVIMQGSTDNTTLVKYTVTCTTGPNVGSWTQLFS